MDSHGISGGQRYLVIKWVRWSKLKMKRRDVTRRGCDTESMCGVRAKAVRCETVKDGDT